MNLAITDVKFKSSSADWQGNIPSHWDVKRLRYLFSMTTGLTITKDNLRDSGIPCINYGEIHSKYGFDLDLERDALRCVDEDYVKDNPSALLEEGDFVFCDTSEDVEGSGNCVFVENLNGSVLFAGSHTVRLHPKDEFNGRFFAYQFKTQFCKRQIQSRVSGIKVFSISQRILKDVVAILPPVSEQRAIAKYLDCETAKIDQMLEAKEKLLKILDEKRRAIITHAVTKGVNPSAKLKSSGIPWLGDIPAHWKIERTRWLFKERDERSETGEEEMLTVSHLTGVTPRSEKDVNMFEAETNEGHKRCQKNDLVINTLWAWMGAMGIAPVDGIVSPAYNVYTPGPELDPAYIDVLVRIPAFIQEVTRYSKGIWASRLRLYPEGFYEVWLPVPSRSEQCAIVEQIKKETTRIDAMSKATQRSIELLKERRSALITEAVTGKTAIN